MKGNKEKRMIPFIVLFLVPFSFLFSQSEEALKILEQNNAGVISLSVFGENKEIVSEGSGFVIGPGVAATSYLLVSQAESVEGKNFKGKKVKIEGILAVDKNLGIALLKIKGKAPALNLGNSDRLGMGNKIFSVGSNESNEIVVSEGEVKNLFNLTASQRIIETSLSIPQNFTGAPLLDRDGQVLGMVIFFERRLKFTLPSNVLKTIQKQSVIKFKDWQKEDYLSTLEGAYLAGRVASLFDDTYRAETYLGKVVKASPDNIEVHTLLASVYTRQRNYQSAVSAYKKVIELDNNRDDAHYGLGIILLRMRQYSEAVLSLKTAVQLNLDHKYAYFHIGNAHEELREFDKAAEAYENFLNFKPENAWEGYFRLGLCRAELEEYDKAIAAFQEALKEKPQDIKVNYQLAQAYQKAAQYEKAEEIYKLLAQLTPEDTVNYYKTILMMYDKAKMPEKAVEAAKMIIQLEPDNSDAIYNLGYMYVKLKNYNEAIKTFNEVIKIRPHFEWAHAQIGFCYSQLKNHAKSIEAFKKFVEIVPENSDGWFNIGIGYMQLKNYNNAIEPLRKTIELRPDYGLAYYNLAIAYLNLHDNYSARDVYNKLKTIDSNLAKKLSQYIK